MNSDVLDTVIGVVFVWFLLSSVLSLANEAFSLLTRARAKHLWLAIGKLKDPAKAAMSAQLADTVGRMHFTGKYDVRPTAVTGGSAPSVVPPAPLSPRRFAAWMTRRPERKNSPAKRDVRDDLQRLYTELSNELAEIAKPGRRSKVTTVAAGTLSNAVLSLARNVGAGDIRASAVACGWDTSRLAALDAAMEALSPGPLAADDVLGLADGSTLLTDDLRLVYVHAAGATVTRDLAAYFAENETLRKAIARAAETADVGARVAAAKHAIEAAFEREMDQLSAFYRRHTRKILGILAIPLVLFTHANAVAIYDGLRHDAALREATLSAATAAADESTVKNALGDACPVPTTSPSTDPVDQAVAQLRCASSVVESAKQFRVGLAWQELIEAHGAKGSTAALETADVGPYLRRALWDDWGYLGRALTVVALLFGAQFWFDILRRLTGLRSTVRRERAAT